MPCSFAAAMTSSSRTLPPGWITISAHRPRRGVDTVAEREERVGRQRRTRMLAFWSRAFMTAMRDESTRLI
jgi:hypothetical protein